MQMLITPAGSIYCLYDESLDLPAFGRLVISRASHVEPDLSGAWLADLSPVSGPTLGPFASRSIALNAERMWLERNWLIAAH